MWSVFLQCPALDRIACQEKMLILLLVCSPGNLLGLFDQLPGKIVDFKLLAYLAVACWAHRDSNILAGYDFRGDSLSTLGGLLWGDLVFFFGLVSLLQCGELSWH